MYHSLKKNSLLVTNPEVYVKMIPVGEVKSRYFVLMHF